MSGMDLKRMCGSGLRSVWCANALKCHTKAPLVRFNHINVDLVGLLLTMVDMTTR